MIYCFDIDGTICRTEETDYLTSVPYRDTINIINNLYSKGDYIKIYTARGSHSGKDWKDFTKRQLDKWGVKYHELIMGKPHADLYIDDRSMLPSDFWLKYERE